MIKIGVVKTSLKENERRIPIYPEHLPSIQSNIRECMLFEDGYGSDFGFSGAQIASYCAGLRDRKSLFKECDLLIIPKPTDQDLLQMRGSQTLFGWVHCVQQRTITQLAIDRHLTLIAWEAMHHWSESKEKLLHIFYKNNEIAGYSAVLHTLQLLGVDGHYGPRKRVVILGYGSVSRGAIYALQGRGFNNIHVFTRRPPHLVADQNPDVYYGQYYIDQSGDIYSVDSQRCTRPIIDELKDADIICNGILQDTNNPVIFVREHEVCKLKPRSIIIDISCDAKMGFVFARPTTFKDPIFCVGDSVYYYSVDHTASYLWNAASREISKALLPFLPHIAAGSDAWDKNDTLRRAIEIRDGVICNPNILSFQNRSAEYPHHEKDSNLR